MMCSGRAATAVSRCQSRLDGDGLPRRKRIMSEKKTTRPPIVCGTDFSATAREAVDIAAAMTKRLRTRLLLLHVDELHRSLVADPIIIESAAVQTRYELDHEARRLRDSGIDVEGTVLAGSAFD